MLEQLKGYPVALVGQPGNRRLVYLGEVKLAIPLFQRQVETLQTIDTLEQVLNRINQTGITQFPVYADETFAGVLTRRGILKWLASVGLNHGTDCSGLRSVPVGVPRSFSVGLPFWVMSRVSRPGWWSIISPIFIKHNDFVFGDGLAHFHLVGLNQRAANHLAPAGCVGFAGTWQGFHTLHGDFLAWRL